MTTQVSLTPPDAGFQDPLRLAAINQLRRKRALQAHLLAYVTVNVFLGGIWWATGAGFYWPMFPLLGWGIGLAFHIWDVYSPSVMSEERIQREMRRLSHRPQ